MPALHNAMQSFFNGKLQLSCQMIIKTLKCIEYRGGKIPFSFDTCWRAVVEVIQVWAFMHAPWAQDPQPVPISTSPTARAACCVCAAQQQFIIPICSALYPPGCSLSCSALTWLTQQPSWHSSQTLFLTNLKRLIFSLFTAYCCRL